MRFAAVGGAALAALLFHLAARLACGCAECPTQGPCPSSAPERSCCGHHAPAAPAQPCHCLHAKVQVQVAPIDEAPAPAPAAAAEPVAVHAIAPAPAPLLVEVEALARGDPPYLRHLALLL